MPSDTLVLCINHDGHKASTREFHRAATRVARKLDGEISFYSSGTDIYRAVVRHESLWHLVIVGHGSPTWIGMPGKYGIHRWIHEPGVTIPASMLSWALKARGCEYVSLATCMSGASPKWYRTKLWGKHVAPWGKAAYSVGGKYSIASEIAVRSGACVRAHTTSGHTTFNPAIREFDRDDGLGMPLKAEGKSIAKWNREVQGERAEDLLIYR